MNISHNLLFYRRQTAHGTSLLLSKNIFRTLAFYFHSINRNKGDYRAKYTDLCHENYCFSNGLHTPSHLATHTSLSYFCDYFCLKLLQNECSHMCCNLLFTFSDNFSANSASFCIFYATGILEPRLGLLQRIVKG